jgi:hypothetical protein
MSIHIFWGIIPRHGPPISRFLLNSFGGWGRLFLSNSEGGGGG